MLHRISTPILVAILLYHGYQYYQDQNLRKSVQNYASMRNKEQPKTDHSAKMITPGVHKVNEEIYVAVGYALGNSIMLIGDDGVVIIDTTESLAKGKIIAEAFRNITDKPVKGVIYTHNHLDHVVGTESFLNVLNGSKDVEIWAHHTFLDIYFQSTARVGKAHAVRAFHQFGVFLDDDFISGGIGVRLTIDKNLNFVFQPPNRVLRQSRQTIQIAGMSLDLIHVPGETDDTICVYWPKHEALLGTDNLYEAFPNLYAIRGTPFRSLKQWYESLDTMRALEPEYFVMSHHMPLIGKKLVANQMRIYRDAVQLVHDQTVRYINQNLHPDDIASRIKLPKHVQGNAYLQEIYGTVKWSSKGLFAGYMGWFSGDITELDPLLPMERAERIVKLAGGLDNIAKEASKALEDNDPQWALFLADSAHKVFPNDQKVKEVKSKALIDMSNRQTSHNGYNYYRTVSLTTLGKATVKSSDKSKKAIINSCSIPQLFHLLSLRFKAEDESCATMDKMVKFIFPDVKQEIRFHVRNGVVDLSGLQFREEDDLKVTVDSIVWRALMTGEWKTSILAEPSIFDLKELMGCFERD